MLHGLLILIIQLHGMSLGRKLSLKLNVIAYHSKRLSAPVQIHRKQKKQDPVWFLSHCTYLSINIYQVGDIPQKKNQSVQVEIPEGLTLTRGTMNCSI